MPTTVILQLAPQVGQQAATQANPMSQAQLRTALDLLKAGHFRTGEDWAKAHQICQTNEGAALFDWVHALVHRIEGDDANAAYWYQRASKARHLGPVEEEWQEIRTKVENAQS